MVRGISAGYLTAGKLEGMAVLPSITLKPGQTASSILNWKWYGTPSLPAA